MKLTHAICTYLPQGNLQKLRTQRFVGSRDQSLAGNCSDTVGRQEAHPPALGRTATCTDTYRHTHTHTRARTCHKRETKAGFNTMHGKERREKGRRGKEGARGNTADRSRSSPIDDLVKMATASDLEVSFAGTADIEGFSMYYWSPNSRLIRRLSPQYCRIWGRRHLLRNRLLWKTLVLTSISKRSPTSGNRAQSSRVVSSWLSINSWTSHRSCKPVNMISLSRLEMIGCEDCATPLNGFMKFWDIGRGKRKAKEESERVFDCSSKRRRPNQIQKNYFHARDCKSATVRVKISYSSVCQLSYARNFRTATVVSDTLAYVYGLRMLLNIVLPAKSTKYTKLNRVRNFVQLQYFFPPCLV